MNQSEKSEYKSAFFSIGVFGGMQVIILLISVLKTKLLAVWIGTNGLGIYSLLLSTISLAFVISNCGLQNSSVRDIASYIDDHENLYKKVTAIKFWNRLLGTVGFLAMLAFSPLLAKWVFADISKWYWFAILSPCIFFMNIYNGLYSILQGLRKVKLLAKASILGAIFGFLFSVPFIYFYRNNGLVPAVFMMYFSTLCISFLLYKKARIPVENSSNKENFNWGLSSLKLGIVLSINMIFVELSSFVIKLFITNVGSLDDVGLFQAGWAINSSYIAVVFTAMAKDYLPRLSQVSNDAEKVRNSIKQQGIISILLLLPLLSVMIVFVEYAIKILYTEEFLAISTMTMLLLLGSLIKAASWSIAYVFIAKSDKKVFLVNELSTKLISVPFYLAGFYYLGLLGLGLAFVIEHIIYFVWIAISASVYYNFRYDLEFWRLFAMGMLALLLLVVLKMFIENSVIWCIPIILIIGICSIAEINKRTGILKTLFRAKS